MRFLKWALLLCAALMPVAISNAAQVFVINDGVSGVSNSGSVGVFSLQGVPVGTSFFPGLGDPWGIAVSDQYVFVANTSSGTIGQYSKTGQVVNASLVSGLNHPVGLTLSGSTLYVTNAPGGDNNGSIGKYNLGSAPGTIASSTPSFITGLSVPLAVAVSGSKLFVANLGSNFVGEYDISGAPLFPTLISGSLPIGLAVSGSDLFVAYFGDNGLNNGSISRYNISGVPEQVPLVSGLVGPTGIAIAGSSLFIATGESGTISEYSTSGSLLHATLVSGLNYPAGIAVTSDVPEPGTLSILTLTPSILLIRRIDGVRDRL